MGANTAVVSKLNILRDLGYSMPADSPMLDFGCGSGSVVQELRSLGYQAYGCDLGYKTDPAVDTDTMARAGILRLIDRNHYTLPFQDNMFQVVFSEQVFEHVQNYSLAISEIARVLKPGGACINVFPARYTPIEPHVRVPMATMVQSKWWLYLWALTGLRAEDQHASDAATVASMNYDYLRQKTNYLTKRAIAREFAAHFQSVKFGEGLFLKHSRRGASLYRLSTVLPFIPMMYSGFRTRVVIAAQPLKNA